MVREIADSDDELDLITPSEGHNGKENTVVTMLNALDEPDQLDPLHETLFDQYLTPTQRLSSWFDGNQDDSQDISTSHALDSSTDRFLKALDPSSASVSQDQHTVDPPSQGTDRGMGGKRKRETPNKKAPSKKRSKNLADHDDLHTVEQPDAARTRAKTTYGASDAEASLADVTDFQAMMQSSREDFPIDVAHEEQQDAGGMQHASEMVSIDARTDYTSPLDLSLHLSPPTAGDSHVVNTTKQAASAFHTTNLQVPQSNFFGAHLAGGMTSRSSMGNHQSFSINPEQLGIGFDKINPFGSLSQVSLPGDVDTDETRGIAEIFRSAASKAAKSASTNNTVSHADEPESNPPPERRGERPRTTANEDVRGDGAQCSPQFSQITDTDDQAGNEHLSKSLDQMDNMSTPSAPPEAKSAGRKRGRKPKKAPANEIDQETRNGHSLQQDGELVNRSSRAGTVDSVSNISEVSLPTTNNKHKQPRSAKPEMGPPDLQSKKLPSSELGLDSKEIIGLSPERYVPRVSRRRGRGDSDAQSGEALPLLNPSQADKTVQSHGATDARIEPPPVKGKRGRKSKVKRVRTSEAALLEQQNETPEEDEKEEAREVIAADEQPTKSTDDHLQDSDLDQKLKTEASSALDEADETEKSSTRRPTISIDVPVLSKPSDLEELPASVPEPKKRGRKRKKPLEESSSTAPDPDLIRNALTEKDVNVRLNTSTTVHEHTTCDNHMNNEDDPELDKENLIHGKGQTLVWETKDGATATPTKVVKTPVSRSTHSPLKPLSAAPLFNARARIGLSKRHSIPSLLQRVNRNKEPPKVVEKKEKLSKWQLEEKEQERIAREEAEAEGREYKPLDQLRGKDGLLVEWDF